MKFAHQNKLLGDSNAESAEAAQRKTKAEGLGRVQHGSYLRLATASRVSGAARNHSWRRSR